MSATKHAAASSPTTTAAALSNGLASGGGDDEDWRLPRRPLINRVEAAPERAAGSGSSWAAGFVGGSKGRGGGSVPRSWKETAGVVGSSSFSSRSGLPSTIRPATGWPPAQPKTNNNIGRVPTKAAQRPRRRPASVFDGMGSSSDSSDDDNDDDDDDDDRASAARMSGGHTVVSGSSSSAGVSAAGTLRSSSPSVAEPKAGARLFSSDEDTDDDRGEGGSDSPGPASDGGWPETKRCPPPNLQEGFDGGDGLTAAAAAGQKNVSRSGSGVEKPRCYLDIGDDDWMSDADDEDPAVATPAAAVPGIQQRPTTGRSASSHGSRLGLKRNRSPPVRSKPGDDDYGSGGDCCRGDKKTGRSERYPTTPVPRRKQRSSSLSLSPRRPTTAFDGDYDSDAELDDEPPTTVVSGVARKKGAGCASCRDVSTNQHRRGRGHKRRHEDSLNDRIRAMRVGSDGEEQGDGGAFAQWGRDRGQGTGGGGCVSVCILEPDGQTQWGMICIAVSSRCE